MKLKISKAQAKILRDLLDHNTVANHEEEIRAALTSPEMNDLWAYVDAKLEERD
jgi:hypothetical protein